MSGDTGEAALANRCGAIWAGREAGKGNGSTPSEMQIAIQTPGARFQSVAACGSGEKMAARPASGKKM
ncbi:MAG: hypothetical protein ACHQ5A_11260, partial [Opitutales bacterium]